MGTDGKLERMAESFQTPCPPPQPSSQPLTPSSALSYKEARSAATSALEANVSEDGLVASKVSKGRREAAATTSSANSLMEEAYQVTVS